MHRLTRRFWIPLGLGVVMGLLAGLVNIFNLTFMSPTGWPIGFYNIFLFIACAIGGPLGGIGEIIMLTMINSLGPIEWREAIDLSLYWANVIVEGLILFPWFGIAYRSIFKRLKMPLRLLPIAGFIVLFYVLDILLIPLLQYVFNGWPIDASLIDNFVSGLTSWYPQVIFDILIISILFFALPERYRSPQWCELNTERSSQKAKA